MNREALEHVLRASAAIAQEKSFVVVGSQAVLLPFPDAPATVVSPDLHDIAVSKCVAGRDKDAQWVTAMLRHGLIERPRLIERLRQLDPQKHVPDRLEAWARRRATEATAS